MDHQEIFAIAHMLQTAEGQIPTDDFAQGFLQGVHYMEILHEIRVMEKPDPIASASGVCKDRTKKADPIGPPPPHPVG